jgi:hypothetical protein
MRHVIVVSWNLDYFIGVLQRCNNCLGIRFNLPVWWIRGAFAIDAVDKQLIISKETDMLETHLPAQRGGQSKSCSLSHNDRRRILHRSFNKKRKRRSNVSVDNKIPSPAGLGAPPGISGVIAASE